MAGIKIYTLPCGSIYVNESEIDQCFYVGGEKIVLKPRQVHLTGGSHIDLVQYMLSPAFWESKKVFEGLLKQEGHVDVLVDVSKVDRWGDNIMLTIVPKGYAQFHATNVFVDVWVNPKFVDVWKNHPYVRDIFTEEPKGKKYDISADLNNIELRWETEKNCANIIMDRAGLHSVNKTPIYTVSTSERAWATEVLATLKKPVLGLSRASSAHIRTWAGMDKLAETMTKRGWSVIVLDEQDATGNFKYDFRHMGALVEQCNAIVANDSAVLHLAGALKRRVFGVFGHTGGEKICENYEKSVVIQSTACSKAPCWWKVPCIPGPYYRDKENEQIAVRCLDGLQVDEVCDAIERGTKTIKKVLAVMLTYNMLEWTKLAIDSIRSYHDVELLVVDNESTDGTQVWCQENGITCLSRRQSVAAAQNMGLVEFFEGDYDYFLLLNNDICLRYDTVDKLVDVMEKSKSFAGITSQEVGNVSPWMIDDTQPLTDMASTKEIIDIPTSAYSCTIFRRQALQDVGIFDEHFTPRYIEDNDHLIRLRIAGWKFGKVQNSIYYHLVGGVLTTNELEKRDKDIHWIKNIAYYIEKWGIHPHEPQDLGKLSAEHHVGEFIKNIDELLKTRPMVKALVKRLYGGIGDVIFVGIVGRELKKKYGDKVEVYYWMTAHDDKTDQRKILKNLQYINGFATIGDVTLDLTEVDFRNEWQECAKLGEITLPRTALHLKIAGLLEGCNDLKPDYIVSDDEAKWAENEWQRISKKSRRVVVCPKGSNALKQWHGMDETLAWLKNQGKYAVIVDDPIYTFRQLASLISRAHLVISPDSGPSNVAGALDIPVITLFSNRNGKLFEAMFPSMIALQGHCPLGRHHCDYFVPCAKTEGPYRPKENGLGEPDCFKNLKVKEMTNLIEEVLG